MKQIDNHRNLLLPGANGLNLKLTTEDGELWLGSDNQKVLVVTKDEATKPWKDIQGSVAPRWDAARGVLK